MGLLHNLGGVCALERAALCCWRNDEILSLTSAMCVQSM